MDAAHGGKVEVAHGDLVVPVFLHRLAQRIDLGLVALFCSVGSEGCADKSQHYDEGTAGKSCKSHRDPLCLWLRMYFFCCFEQEGATKFASEIRAGQTSNGRC